MPKKSSGAASRRHPPTLESPIPGSISTGATPALNSAKTSAKKSSPGLTITAARVCGPTPNPASPEAIQSLSSSSWRYVRWL